MVCVCRTSQSNILAKKFFITHMGISCTKCRNPPLLLWAISIKQARDKSAVQMSSFKMCFMARAISTQGCKLIEPGSGLYFSGSHKLSDRPFCVCATTLKSSVCSEITKHFLYKCHGLFDNSPVMTTV